MSAAKVYVIGTCDTKGAELRFACDCVARAGAGPVLVDVSTATPDQDADVTAETVAGHHPKGKGAVLGHSDRGQAVTAMAEALTRYLLSRTDIGAVLGLVVVNALRSSPWGTTTIALTIPIAMLMGGYLRWVRPGRVLEASVMGIVLLLLALYAGRWVAEHPTLGPLNVSDDHRHLGIPPTRHGSVTLAAAPGQFNFAPGY